MNQNLVKMDFITPIIKLIWPLIRKLWPFIVISILAAVIWHLHNRKEHYKAESMRNEANINNLLKKASKHTQVINITRRQLNENKELKHTVDSLAKELKIKPKKINSVTFIEVEKPVNNKSAIDSSYIKGVEDGKKNLVLTSEFKTECYDLTVQMIPDSGFSVLSGVIDLSHTKVTELKPKKGWFWKGWWFKNKWDIENAIIYKCDSVLFNKNLTINIDR